MKPGTFVYTGVALLLAAVTVFGHDHPAASYREIAECYASRGNQDAAVHYYDKALASNPTDVLTYQSRGFFYLKLGRQDNAADDFSGQIRARPEDPPGYLNRGMLRGIVGDDAGSRSDFAKACELGSEDGCAMLVMPDASSLKPADR